MATYTIYNEAKNAGRTHKAESVEQAIQQIENLAEDMVSAGFTITQELSHYPRKHQYGIHLAIMEGDRLTNRVHLFVSL